MSNYSASELFSDWYSSGIKGDRTTEEISSRKKSILQVLKNKKKEFWMDLLRICYDLQINATENRETFIQCFKSVDDSFPLIDNHNLVRTLARCTVAQKIEKNDSYLCNSLALGVLTIPFLGRESGSTTPQITSFSDNFWKNECSRIRNLRKIDLKESKINLKKIEFQNPVGSAEIQQETNESIAKDLKNLSSNQNQLLNLKETVNVLSEELNVLWWIFGGHSRDFDIKLSDLGFPDVLIQISKELADLTKILPGFSHIDSLINKSLDTFILEKVTELNEFHIYFKNSTSLNVHEEILKKYDLQVGDLTPCLSAINLKVELGKDNDTWLSTYFKKYEIKENGKLKPSEFAKQLYLEQMLLATLNMV